jgi:hypothetical protein
MITYIAKGQEKEEYTHNPVRERCPPAERHLEEV